MQQRSPHQPTNHASSVANDGLLHLAPNLIIEPDVILSNGNGIFGAGVQGSGKTTVLKRLLEQIARKAQIPIVVFDREEDMLATVDLFPRGVIGTYQNCPTARDIYEQGLQVVYSLSTWPNRDMAGIMIAQLVNQLMHEAEMTPPQLRVPCLIGLDEASFWLPQKRGNALDEDTYAALYDAFDAVVTRGRKRGLVSALFTKSFSQINKDVLSPGTYILMRQNIHTERARYLDYILPIGEFAYFNARQKQQRIGDLKKGEAIVRLATGEQVVTRFYPCESKHISHTPRTQAALKRYGALSTIDSSFGMWLPEDEMVQQTDQLEAPTTKKSSGAERVRALLAQDSTLRPAQLARLAECDPSTASRERNKFLASQQQ